MRARHFSNWAGCGTAMRADWGGVYLAIPRRVCVARWHALIVIERRYVKIGGNDCSAGCWA